MNLTQTASFARKVIAVSFCLLAVYSIGYFSFPYLKKTFFPTKEEPSLIYGKLLKPKFDGIVMSESSVPEYVLNTNTGRLPNITPKLFSVYQVKKPSLPFSPGKQAQAKAFGLKFKEEDLISGLKGNIYKWSDQRLSRDLEINITSDTLNYSVNILNNKDNFEAGSIKLDTPIEENAKEALKLLGYYKDILYEHGSSKVSFGKISNNRVEETTTPLEYTFAKADFYRTIYKAPIYGPRFDEGMLQIVMAIPPANKEELSTVKIQAHEWSLDTDKFGRYPSLNVAEAWKKVSANQGVVSKLKLRSSSSFEKDSAQTVSKIFIENVSIGYYDSPNFQPYMQPIYVFDGTFTTPDGQQGQIAIYYPALDPKVFN